ncbi:MULTISPECIES: DUF3995 domain-containing protein [Streptomyces]|uniref:DUF3995 domain-containing protein n=1 Tax=Streptomyces TaxID=1883 RepID=UPI00163C587B|nr:MULTISPECIES: DUF3995 domain-containing protein [Streptomyces]MBC2875048.1 DUF3995 domain-containing protein [Streptomyces sp. TYQ1024]UBI37481.1 DUF3995 domain-containing protein [Streptomyces mobaraensis]UKW30071.1 DUF3995 domain-containing protein [Streptomyces sp. TYQ1024]
MDLDPHAIAPRAARLPQPLLRAAAYAAAAWAIAFSLVHLYWLFDGRIGLPAGLSVRGDTPLLVIDVLAVPVCAVAAALALALVRPWGTRLPAGPLTVLLWGTTALLLFHAAPSVPDWAALAVGARTASDLDAMGRFATFLYEPFFMTGGLLFALACLGRRAGRPRGAFGLGGANAR